MGTHPIFESDFDCLTDVDLSGTFLAMARTSPVSLVVISLILVVIFLAVDLHSKSQTLFQQQNSSPLPLVTKPLPLVDEQSDDIVIYNRIPKTASTAFTHVVYDLCKERKRDIFVVHVNTTVKGANAAIMSLQDQQDFRENVTSWELGRPSFFHGHFAFLPFPRGKQPIYINLIRDPLDRLVSYYYFIRYGDNFRVGLKRSKQGDNTTFNQCVEKQLSKDCTISKMWVQIPYFCGQLAACWDPGSQWALDRAKQNLLDHYFLVGTTERLDHFVQMLELHIPKVFKGAYEKIQSQSPIRKTLHKDPISNSTRARLSNTKVWRMEYDFYRFAEKERVLFFNLLFWSLAGEFMLSLRTNPPCTGGWL